MHRANAHRHTQRYFSLLQFRRRSVDVDIVDTTSDPRSPGMSPLGRTHT